MNPNLFPEGTNYKVTAVCGVRKGMKFGSTENYRKAQGLKSSQINFPKIGVGQYHISDRPITEAPFDALNNYANKTGKTGVKFDEETVNNHKMGIFGRGNSDYLIEPMALAGDDAGDWSFYQLPAYEVIVTVTVEHDGRTFVYSRTYLPEYEECDAASLNEVYNNAKAADKTHYTELYNSQMNHIQSIRAWIARTPICNNSIMTFWETTFSHGWTKEEESGYALLDSDPSTCWFSSKNSRFNGKCGAASNKTFGGDWTCSWVEFYTYFRNTPESFTLTCGKDTRHCPEDIRLFASSDGKNYELIYCELGFNKRFNPNQGATTVCRIKADKQKPYKYYRFEGSGNDIDYSFAELTMNYKN